MAERPAKDVDAVVRKMAKAMHAFLCEVYADGFAPSLNDIERALRVAMQQVYIPAPQADAAKRIAEQNADLILTIGRYQDQVRELITELDALKYPKEPKRKKKKGKGK